MSNIVIYEEDDAMRALLEEWLADAGYSTQGVAQHRGQPVSHVDLVIVSVYMPKHGGAQLIREVRATHAGTPLIALSSQFRSGLSATGATAQALGVQRVIAKPLTRRDLLDAVRDMIGLPKDAPCARFE
jgi:DNA-binding response OmpR family regulator